MGAVYEAVDAETNERVAVKVVAADGAESDRARLRLEGETLARLVHPSIVGYRAHGADDRAAWLALEWVDGQTLAERLAQQRLTPLEAITCVARIARALEAAHASGVVHRDVKPANVILRDGAATTPVLVDFGIARADRTVLTATGAWLGTPRYIAPEQLRDAHHVEGRADVFSLAAVLYELLAHTQAFPGTATAEVLAGVLFNHPPRLDAYLDGAADTLVALVDAGLSKSPDARPDARAFAVELEALLQDEPALARITPRAVDGARPVRAITTDETVGEEAPSIRSPMSPPKHTFGRATHLEALDRAFDDGARTVALWGAPGVGKTHLATAAAARARSAVRVRLPAGRAEDLGRALAEALGYMLSGAPEPAHVARWLDRDRVDLVVVDDLPAISSELVDAVESVGRYAPRVRWLTVCVARPDDERVTCLEVPPLEVTDAAALLSVLVVEAGGSAPAPPTCELVARALDGLPVALTLTAREIAVAGEAAVVAHLEGDEPAPHSRMMRALDGVLAPLSERHRRVLAHAALFEGACTTALLQETLLEPDRARLLDDLAELRDRGIVRREDVPALGPTLRVLASVRAPARQHLVGAELDEAHLRHGKAILAAAAPHAAHARATGDPRALSALGLLASDALRAAERLAHGGAARVVVAVGLAAAIAPLLLGRGEAKKLQQLLREIDDASLDSEDHRRTLRVLSARADAVLGERARALEVLGAAASGGDDVGELLLDMGVVLHGLRRHDEAHAAYERAAERLSADGDLIGQARAWGNLGALAHDRGDASVAEQHYRRAAETLELVGEERLRGVVLGNLAVLVQERGVVEQARALYGTAIELLSRAGDVRLEGIAHGNLGLLEHEQGDLAAAAAAHERARALLERTGDLRSEALALGRLAAALADRGDVGAAQRLVADGLRLSLRQDDRLLVPFFHLVSAFCQRARAASGEPSAAASADDALARATAPVEPGGELLLERSDDARTLHRIFTKGALPSQP